jgi:DHA1 family tetracycline resistance protein-like MFS transporter
MKDKRILLIYAIVLIDIAAGSVMWPILPELVKGTSLPSLWLAAGSGLFLGIQIFTAPLLGTYSDLKGRKPVFIISAIGTFIATLFLLRKTPLGFIANRASDGLTNGVYGTVRSAITDISSKDELIKNMGIEGTIVSIGFVLGPLLSGILLYLLDTDSSQATLSLVYLGAGLSLINVILSFLFKETHFPQKVSNESVWQIVRHNFNPAGVIKDLKHFHAQHKKLAVVLVLNFCLVMSLGYYHYFVTFISLGELKMSPRSVSLFFIYMGVVSMIFSFVFFSYFAHKINVRKFISVVSVLGIATHLAYAMTGSSVMMLYIIITIDCLTVSLLPGIFDTLLAEITTDENRGRLFGINQLLTGTASLLTAVIYGILSIVSIEIPFYWFGFCLLPLTVTYKLMK